jgi:hypothetical protein
MNAAAVCDERYKMMDRFSFGFDLLLSVLTGLLARIDVRDAVAFKKNKNLRKRDLMYSRDRKMK